MKRLSLSITVLLIEGPAPFIKGLRALVESGKANFRNTFGASLEMGTPTRTAIYKTAKKSAVATTEVMRSLDGGKRVYMIRYDVKVLSTDMQLMINRFINRYISELTVLVKRGSYTEIWYNSGNDVPDYKSKKYMRAIYLYGLVAATK